MSWKIWKKPLERANEEYEKGFRNGVNLSDWESAFSHFNKACQLFSSEGDQRGAQLANTLAILSKALYNSRIAENWTNASSALASLGVAEINLTQLVSTTFLSQECKLKALELKARGKNLPSETAKELEDAAKEYLSLGNRNLMLPLLLERKQSSAQSLAHKLIADASRIRGDEILESDSRKASEFYRMAAMHMKTAGNLESFNYLSEQADAFSSSGVCYFCGREVVGKEVNFVGMKANLTKSLKNKLESQVLPSNISGNVVIACKGCHSAITIAADEIAKVYFEKVETELKAFQQHVDSELSSIKSALKSLNHKIRT